MNLYSFLILLFIIIASLTNGSPVGYEEETTRRPEEVTSTHPTFTVQRLDSPIERIEIRLIDDNTTHAVPEIPEISAIPVIPEVTVSTVREENEERMYAGREEISTTEQIPENHVHEPDQDQSPAPTPDDMYKKVEYVVQPTSPIVIGEDPYYYSTMSSDKEASEEIQAKAWISVSTSIPKFEGDIDEDDLPPPPASEDSENEEPEEECLANKDKLTDEVIERLRSETTMYYRLVRQRNDQQKEFCGTEAAHDTTTEMYRRCSNWRAEKLVYYYKLMRKTYCQVDNWPNSPKIKKTYGEYLNLFGTFYAFQK